MKPHLLDTFRFVVVVILLLACTGCVTTYKRMAFDYIPLHTEWNAIDHPNLHMFIDHDVLTEPGMKPYARLERKNKVNLVELTVHNTGATDFIITRDVTFRTVDGVDILPLPLEEALSALIEPITDRSRNSAIEIDGPSSLNILKAANTAKRIASHIRFATDITEHYIADSVLAPGAMMRGLLVLPVERGTIVKTSIRQ